jgi:hypothetical protein
MDERRSTYRVLVGKKLRERDTFEDTDVNGRIILNWICKRDRMGPRLD